jgi:hypothetical protein
MTTASSSAIIGGSIWEATQRLGLYGLGDAELEALITRHGSSPLPGDRIAVEAAQYVRQLRSGLARGDTC